MTTVVTTTTTTTVYADKGLSKVTESPKSGVEGSRPDNTSIDMMNRLPDRKAVQVGKTRFSDPRVALGVPTGWP